eukprot:jgi/Astpho2/7799/Aster-06090
MHMKPPSPKVHPSADLRSHSFLLSHVSSGSGCFSRKKFRLNVLSSSAGDSRVPPEADVHYRRQDLSAQHAFKSRRAFLRCLAQGEGSINLAEAALHVAAEDDALVSHGSVQLPLQPYQQRIQRLASDIAARLERLGPMASDRQPEAVLQASIGAASDRPPEAALQ